MWAVFSLRLCVYLSVMLTIPLCAREPGVAGDINIDYRDTDRRESEDTIANRVRGSVVENRGAAGASATCKDYRFINLSVLSFNFHEINLENTLAIWGMFIVLPVRYVY